MTLKDDGRLACCARVGIMSPPTPRCRHKGFSSKVAPVSTNNADGDNSVELEIVRELIIDIIIKIETEASRKSIFPLDILTTNQPNLLTLAIYR